MNEANNLSMSNSAVGLARSFSIVIHLLADLMFQLRSEKTDLKVETFPCTQHDVKHLIANVEERLRDSWLWLIKVMDSTESQLRFGCALSNRRQSLPSAPTTTNSTAGGSASGGNPSGNNSNSISSSLHSRIASSARSMGVDIDLLLSPLSARHYRMAGFFTRPGRGSESNFLAQSSSNSYNNSSHNHAAHSDPNVSRRDFLGYAMSLMRAQSSDHYDSMPVLDVASLKHVAYIFDAFFYYIRQGIKCEQEREAKEAKEANVTREHGFFRRTNSTLFLGCPPPDPFLAPFHQTLPLADKPHLLTPNARREVLFGVPRPLNSQQTEEMIRDQPTSLSLFKRQHPKWSDEITHSTLKTEEPGPSTSQPQQHRSVIVMGPSAKRSAIAANLPSVPAPFTGHEYAKVGTIYPNPIATVDEAGNKLYFGNQREHDHLLGRWRILLEAFGRLFVDDVGIEPASIINELITFQVKETKFRREIERLRSNSSTLSPGSLLQPRDFHLLRLERERGALLQQTFKELNNLFSSVPKKGYNQFVHRVKITFKNEPGEGTGVARSFFSAFCEAVLENEKLPTLDWLLQPPPAPPTSGSMRSYNSAINATYNNLQQYNLIRVTNNGQSSSIYIRPSDESSRSSRNSGRFRLFTPRRFLRTGQDPAPLNRATPISFITQHAPVSFSRFFPLLRYEAPLFTPTDPLPADERDHSPGDLIYSRLELAYPQQGRRITGMLLDIPGLDINRLVEGHDELREIAARAYDIVLQHENPERADRLGEGAAIDSSSASDPGTNNSNSVSGAAPAPADPSMPPANSNSSRSGRPNAAAAVASPSQPLQQPPLNSLDEGDESPPDGSVQLGVSASGSNTAPSNLWPPGSNIADNEPLFYQPGPVGFYSPRSGQRSEARLNAFRNIGRMIGICFSQNELCPLSFNRHVIKMIIGRPVQWHDLAFFDSALFDSLRHLVLEADRRNEELFNQLDLTFVVDLTPEEGGLQVELKPNGRNIAVTMFNVYEYVQRYALYRMVESQKPAIDNIRDGIFDVLPNKIFDNLMVKMITLFASFSMLTFIIILGRRLSTVAQWH